MVPRAASTMCRFAPALGAGRPLFVLPKNPYSIFKRRAGRLRVSPPRRLPELRGGASGRPRHTEHLAESGRPHGAVPTVETDHPYNRERSPHPSGLWPPLPLLAFSYFPLTGGIGLPQRGKLYGRVLDPPLRRIQNGFVFLVGAGPRPARQDSHRERWLVKARCRN